MIRASRPLRVIVIVIGGWIAMRIVMLWPESDAVEAPREAAGIGRAATDQHYRLPNHARPASDRRSPPVHAELVGPRPADREWGPSFDKLRANGPNSALDAPAHLEPSHEVEAPPLAASTPPQQPLPSRWGGSAWLIARGGSGAAVPFAPQLGGSQAGARITYALGDARRVAIAARVSTALATNQREAAIGVDWRPTRLPVHLFAEQRIAIDKARGAPAVGVIAGLPPTRLAAGFALEGYGQAGIIARDRGEGFVDAAMRAMRPVGTVGRTRIEFGAGAWGGAQRGAARLDVGPAASAIIPAGRPLRISLEWRQRIAGDARPGAGLALSLGMDF